jgi:DNA-binding MarR family transcriptional regulator
MHSITFAFKRAHLQAVAFGKKAVKRINEMTPAGFDLLYAIRNTAHYHAPWHTPSMAQAELVQTLGLHRSTVSKMLKRLKGFRNSVPPPSGRTSSRRTG